MRSRWFDRFMRMGMTILLCTLVSGCAGLSDTLRRGALERSLGRTAVVASEEAPVLRLDGFPRSAAQGAAAGAAGAFGSCAFQPSPGGCSGSFCGAALIILLGICGIAAAVGGIVGTVTTPSPATVITADTAFVRAADARSVQSGVQSAVTLTARNHGTKLVDIPADAARDAALAGDYRSLVARGIDTVLETSVIEAGTVGGGINRPLMVRLTARVKVIDTGSNERVEERRYVFEGRRKPLDEWIANDGQSLVEDIARGYGALGELIHDDMFALYSITYSGLQGGLFSPAFGLTPTSPATRGRLSADNVIANIIEWTAVDTLQPTLQWQAFPRKQDIEAAPDAMAGVSDVRYDLLVAREEHLAPADIVYARRGLTQPTHTLEVPLRPSTRYFWTVRARFRLAGRERVTEWGTTRSPGLDRITAPSAASYRFRTTAERPPPSVP